MRLVWVWFWLVVAAAHGEGVSTNGVAPAPVPALKRGDVVIFVGDSITAHGKRPGGWIELMQVAMLTDWQYSDVQLVGRGVGGMKLRALRDQFDRDIKWPNPTVVVIEIGMNDLLQPDYEDSPAKRALFELGYSDLIWRTRQNGAAPVLVTHTLYGEKRPGTNTFDKRLDDYSALIRAIGRKKRCAVIELRQPFLAYVAAHNPEDLASGVLTTDGAHFNARGHRFMADLMLKAFGVAPVAGAPAAENPTASERAP
jgi:lysophospholipase L1-like esterase